MLLTYAGPKALSQFRLAPLLERCRELVPHIGSLEATHLYLVWAPTPLDQAATQRLGQLLDAQKTKKIDRADGVVIAPRPGTISPWSSKATDILHHCGLESIDRVERATFYRFAAADGRPPVSRRDLEAVLPLLYDRMTEAAIDDPTVLFAQIDPGPLVRIPLQKSGRTALAQANQDMGLALSEEEIDYFLAVFIELKRDPTDVELMMFSVVNSEHCRHKIFNASWTVDGIDQPHSLFDMIRHTHKCHPEGSVKAYSDNSGVLAGWPASPFRPQAQNGNAYGFVDQLVHILLKVETHNHPTAISPYPGASTGVGGEIRDEGATGIGGQPQAGLCAFFTSHLRLPELAQPWEKHWAEFPERLATPLEIMTEGPIGGAGFGNEFGRPNITGIFRTLETEVNQKYRAYHKPIMVAGGVGVIDAEHVEKKRPEPGDWVIQLGGPAMLIGLGGGAASSMAMGSNQAELDFASVQRDNPEMERRCQELINRCIGLGAANPILSIHDVGAGGLSNACPELVEATGAKFDLRAIKNDDPGMSPMQIWCNEAQERYVLVIARDDLDTFAAMAARERCLFAAIGQISGDAKLTLTDPLLGDKPIDDLDLEVILGKPPQMHRTVTRLDDRPAALDLSGIDLADAVDRVLHFPAVASKSFLITIADRTVTGLIARDQMVGPYQVPIADVGVTSISFKGHRGSAMAMGERTPLALIDAAASGRMAIAEALSNIAAAPIGAVGKIKLSANWMCACDEAGEDAKLFDTVRAVGLDFCPAVGISIPVGKDSLSMRAVWQDSDGRSHKAVSPLSLVVSAFAPVQDVRRVLTPELKSTADSILLLIDMGRGHNRLGGSSLAQVYNQMGDCCPDIDPADLGHFFAAIQALNAEGLLLAYHDRSDGGLFAAAAEMAFAARRGLDLDISPLGEDNLAALFNEEIGALVQIRRADLSTVQTILAQHQLDQCTHPLGHPSDDNTLSLRRGEHTLFAAPVPQLLQQWSETSYHVQAQRDNPQCAREEFDALADSADPGMRLHIPYPVEASRPSGTPPRIAVLREQGINGQVEMAAAFTAAGFVAVDVTMTDLLNKETELSDFVGLVACGGFSYGDVLGAGAGWARSILFNEALRQDFAAFFARPETFGLGVCNGCQMFSHLAQLIPGSQDWPRFERNRSEQFEARYSTVEITENRSVLLRDMAGARLGIAVAHGEGRVQFADPTHIERFAADGQLCMRYVDNQGQPTERYPLNPNGSPQGITALTNADGRFTIMMPHPERVFRNIQLSWHPADWSGEESPWLKLFQNAYDFAAGN